MEKATNYERITGEIIAELEKGTVPWDKPWSTFGAPRNAVSGKAYRGINTLLLTLANHADPRYLTFKQAKDLGGFVRKGSRGQRVVYFKMLESKTETTSKGTPKSFPMLKLYTVFNVSQCAELDLAELDTTPRNVTPIESAEAIVAGYENAPTIDWVSAQASYRPSTDIVSMPRPELFDNDAVWYGTLFHELAHSTGHESRLNRATLTKTNKFGSEAYGREELVAELGAAFLLGAAGLEPEITRSASYLQAWIKVLKADAKAIVSAASAAQKASDHILGV
ncbi:antirestriction protein [uncultured Mediterranean phage uvDeep-CGR2-AD3-C76]|nr:antirestriction protein [uncultured Mediterranean phage uvDeep-CGR2-AD3-C76]